MIYLATTAPTVPELLRQVADQEPWIDGVEVRADLLQPAERADSLRIPGMLRDRGSRLELLFTVRRSRDGGRWSGEEHERLGLLERAVGEGYTLIDLESDLPSDGTAGTIAALTERHGVTVVRSHHDFRGLPADLAGLMRRLPRSRREVAKCAVTPQSTSDLLSIVRASDALGARPHILLGMGPFGFPTRVLLRRLGNLLTFASAPGESAAPGHVSAQVLEEQYRLRAHRESTRYFAVIGNPIAHSQSPAYHNRRFAEDRIDACYLPVLVDDVPAFFELAELLPLHGFSVTIPHKRSVIAHLSEAGADVRAANACNTVLRAPSGWRGLNTDVTGFLAPLEDVVGAPLEGMRVLVLGAGGSARAVVYGLLSRGAEVVVWNRTVARARALADDMRRLVTAGTLRILERDESGLPDPAPDVHVVVNTTSLGMGGAGDPAPWFPFHGSEVVYDIVYTPPETPLIRRASDAGCRVITGDRMFAAQAAAQYELYRALATPDGPGV